MKKIGIVCLLLAMLILSSAALTPAARAADLPEPSDVFYVLDEANVLSDETWEEIVSKDESLETQTGAQVCVVTVEFTGSSRISDYAYELFNEWGIGDKTKNNGVLLLIVTGAEDYYMLQGTGLEEVLPSSELQIILDEYMEPYFARGDYDAGVRATAGEVFSRLADWYGISLSVPAENIVTYPAQLPEGVPVQLPGSVITMPETTDTGLFGGLFGLIGGLIGLLTRGVFGLVIIILIIILCVLSSGRRRRIFRGGMYRGFRPPMPPPPGGFGMRGPGMGPGFGPRSGPGMGPRPGNFGSRPGSFGSSHHSSFGGTRSGGFGGSHTGSFGGGHSSHVGGGGASRGGGAGRH